MSGAEKGSEDASVTEPREAGETIIVLVEKNLPELSVGQAGGISPDFTVFRDLRRR
jgi:hypothetical protein